MGGTFRFLHFLEVIFSCITPITPSHFFPSRCHSRFPYSSPHSPYSHPIPLFSHLLTLSIYHSPVHPLLISYPLPFYPHLYYILPHIPPTSHSKLPIYLPIHPQANPTSHSPSISPSHPLSTSPHHIPMLPYFPSLLVIPDSHSSEPLFTQSPIVSPNHHPLILLPLSS